MQRDFSALAYPWVKAAHVIFVIFWIAGLFMLPRFYVYHQETTPGSAEDRAWIEREDRVRTIILTPAMILVWLLGLMLAYHHRRLRRRPGSSPSSRWSSACPAIRAGSAPTARRSRPASARSRTARCGS